MINKSARNPALSCRRLAAVYPEHDQSVWTRWRIAFIKVAKKIVDDRGISIRSKARMAYA